MKRGLNKILFLTLISVFICSCSSKQFLVVSDPQFDFNSDYCNLQDSLKKKTVKLFYSNGVIADKKNIIQIQVIFRGKDDSFIGIVNCNDSFQAPVFLCFYDGHVLKVITDSFDLEILYIEYLNFVTINQSQNREEIWTYIENFSKKELTNKYDRINF